MAYRKKTYKRKTFKRKSYAPKTKKTAFKKAVKKVLASQIENKTAQLLLTGQNLVSSNNLGFATQNIFDCGISASAIQIYQGVGQGQRIGNRIQVTSLVLKGTITPLPYSLNNTVPKPTQVKMWIFYDRYNPTTQPDPYNDFFQNGNSNNNFQNDLIDMWMPVNTDRYRVLATKQFKLGYASYGQAADTVYPSVIGINNNNDFKLNCNYKFNLTKHIPKRVTFRDNNGDPTSRGIYCMIALAAADGSQFVATTTAANHQYMVSCTYRDA